MAPPDLPPSVSNQKAYKDYVTPHKISLLVLIKEFCLVKTGQKNPTEETWVHTNQQNRDFAITMLKLIQNPDMDLKRLINIIHPVLHPKTYQAFVDKLQELRKKGVCGIMDYIGSLDTLLVEPAPVVVVIQKSSVLGLFIRRMLLAFDKLSFSHICKLSSKFDTYCDAVFGSLGENAEDSISDLHLDETLEESDSEDFQVLATQKQAEYFIAQQAALLQINEGAALSPPQLQQKIKELVKGNPELSEAHYLSYINSLRVKEFCGARENLYHHFDRNTAIPQDCKSSTTVSEDLNRSSRYAALNLAILHALFGHKEEALAALNEAVRVAQEVNDNICLQHALAWLYRLVDDNKEILIERSIAKSGELGLWNLSTLGVQALTKLRASTPASPSDNLDLLIKSDIQNCQHSMTDALGPTFALRAGLWSNYGHSMMSNLTDQMLLHLNTSDNVRGGVYHVGEGICIALRNLAMMYANQGEHHSAIQITKLAKELFPPHSRHSHIWQLGDLIRSFNVALYSAKWQDAHRVVKGIAIFDKEEADYRKAELLLHQGNISNASEELIKLQAECEEKKSFPHFHIRAMLLRAELLCETPNYELAMPLLMTCMAMCKTYHLMLLEAITAMHIARVQLMQGHPNQAQNLLNSYFMILLMHGSIYDKGCLYLLCAKCSAYLAMQKEDPKAFSSILSLLEKALGYFEKIKMYTKIKFCQGWKAHLYNYLGMTEKRNSTARQFRDTIENSLS